MDKKKAYVEIREEEYVPKNLYFRLSRRISAKYFLGYYFVVLFIMIILGILFLNAVYMTRNYIINGDDFWEDYLKNDFNLNLQFFNAFTGVFLICVAVFSIMNNILIIGHIYAGGLKKRLNYANYIFLFFQVVVFLYSLITLCMFKLLIFLYIILFFFSFFNLLNAIIYFLLIRRCTRRENAFMLSIRRMEAHKQEYYNEYISRRGAANIN